MSGDLNPPRDGEGDRRPKADGGGRSLRRPAVYAARKLRREMSLPEVLLWQRLKGAPGGLGFRKQHAIDPYVVDFYCPAARLIVEVDGEAHDRGNRPERDDGRAAYLAKQRYHLLRIAAGDVLKDVNGVAEGIIAYANDPLHHAFGMVPLPTSGEDF